MDTKSKDMILGPGDSIRTCYVRVVGRQDFKTQRAERDANQKTQNHGKVWGPQSKDTWDFVLTDGDGHSVHLHPSHKGPKVQAHMGQPPVDDEVPRAGRGGSDGRGTFKKFKQKGYDMALKFGR